jgi:hypothetical protein
MKNPENSHVKMSNDVTKTHSPRMILRRLFRL